MDIKKIREKSGMIQKEFAEYFNIPVRTLQDWEHEKRTPPKYVIELIQYKIKKEMEEMKKLDRLILNEDGEKEIFYIAIDYTGVFHISTEFYDVSNPEEQREVRQIEVYHDGLYFGTTEEMEDYIIEKIIDHLKEEKHIVKDGKTIMGENIWKWRE